MTRGTSHYSRKAARRVLDALMRLGGRGTTAQIHEITGGCATHSDVHSLRCWLRHECGYTRDDALAAVRTVPLGLNASGRNVYRYELREDMQDLHRQQRGNGDAQAPRIPGGPASTSAPASSRPLARQGTLFDTRSAARERRRT